MVPRGVTALHSLDETAALEAVNRQSHDAIPVVRSKRKVTDQKVLNLLNLNRGKLLRLS